MSNIGRVIFGFCGGFFGRDSYRSKRIEAEGIDWIVARGLSERDFPEFAWFEGGEIEKQIMIHEWSLPNTEDINIGEPPPPLIAEIRAVVECDGGYCQ